MEQAAIELRLVCAHCPEPAQSLRRAETIARRGLLLLSDGLAECFNPADEMFGEARVEQCLQASAAMTPNEIIGQLLAAAEAWAAGRKLEDDLTLVVLKAK